MKILELFSGTECISNAFRERGHECFTVDWDEKFPSSLHIDIEELTADMILKEFGYPDVMFLAPDCRTYSIAAISHHRRKNEETGELEPVSGYAQKCDRVNWHIMKLIKELKPKLFFIENPRGAYRKMPWIRDIPRYTITHCQYSLDLPPNKRRAKPTDIFTNHPDPKFKPPCKNGSPCHIAAPRGSKTGTQGLKNAMERAVYPKAFCEHIVDICEGYLV